MSDLVSTFRSYALDKDNFPRMDTEVVYVRVGLLKEAADRIDQLEAALREIEYLDRPQVRGLPRRVSIQEIARPALGEGRA